MSTLLGYFFLALGVSFICSTLESVILSVTHSHIGILVKTNHRSGKLLQHLKDDINRPLAAILTLTRLPIQWVLQALALKPCMYLGQDLLPWHLEF